MIDKDLFKIIKTESSDYSPDDITEGFPYFCLKVFWELSEDEISDALINLETDDDSIDAFFIDEENKELNIIQFKSCESEKQIKALKKEWLSYFADCVPKLEDNQYIDNHKNQRIKEIAKDFAVCKKKGFKVKLHFFHLGRADKNTLDHHSNITYYDLEKIKEGYEEFNSKRDRTEPPAIDIQLNFEHFEPKISNKYDTFVSIITGDELVRLREKYRYKLFDKNLRFSLGKNKINKGISDTTKSEPELFYFYNNGITITSNGFDYKRTSNKLKIEYPQIINGAQTVNAIYDAYRERKHKFIREAGGDETKGKDKVTAEFKRVKLLFRVIRDGEKGDKKTSEFEEKVIRYNNSQSPIRETDFYANNREQIKLQEIFAKFGYFYEIKRGDRKYLEDNPKSSHNLLNKKKKDFEFWDEKIDIEKLASLWMAYYINPLSDQTKKTNIFEYANNKNYELVFDKEENITEDTVREMILAYHLFEIIKEETEIFGKKKKEGQLITKLKQIKESEDKYHNLKEGLFDNVKRIVENSLIFNDVTKRKFDTKEVFLKDKPEVVINKITEYQFFSNGKYLTLYIFKLILDKCEYISELMETELFKNKKFLKEKIVAKWIPVVLDDLLKEEYKKFLETGASVGSFYNRNKIPENIKERFGRLDMDKDKKFTELFPMDFSKR